MKDKPDYLFQINLYWIYLIGIFLIILQLINILPPWFTPTDWGKAIIFRIILSILIFLFLFQILFKKINVSDIKEKIKSTSLPFYLLVSLFGIYLLSTIFSLDPHFSLWGNPNRNGGFINFAFYILFAILAFLIIRKKDWQKILDFAIIIGIVVSTIAIFQQFGVYSKFFIPFSDRPISTLGNAILLSLYLLLLTFISLSFGIKTKNRLKRIFYFFSFLLFLSISIFLVQTRGAFLGLAAGFLWFLFAYPKKSKKFIISAGIILVLVISSTYFLNAFLKSHLDIYSKIYENIPHPLNGFMDRALSLFDGVGIAESRISAWKVSWNALKDKPILGYGPENFMIAFDKYYDPSLPLIGPSPGEATTEWWDRAHNFVFDISITAGIPALIIYLSFFWVLIWQLQKIKYANSPPSSSLRSDFGNANGHMRIYSQDAVISNGIQATFIGYLVSLLFSFDCVSTYLVSFLLIGYSLNLINSSSNQQTKIQYQPFNEKKGGIISYLYRYKVPTVLILFIFLIFFIQVYNLKPFLLNKEVNNAVFYSENKRCEEALTIVNNIYPKIKGSIIDSYLNQKSSVIIYNCVKEETNRNQNLINRAIQIIKEMANTHPNYLQNWFALGEYINILIEEKNKLTDNVFVPSEEMNNLKEEANSAFEKAYNLSPKRQIILREWATSGIITGEYEKAKEKVEECINLNPYYAPCMWVMALAQGYSGNLEEFNYFFNLAKEKGYNTEAGESLKQLVNMYIKIEDYRGLAEVYPKLIQITEDKNKKAQLYASLAVVYKELGQIKKARDTALKALELLPEAKPIVDEFLKSLEQ